MRQAGNDYEGWTCLIEKISKEGRWLYRCEECGLHYFDADTAGRCERWCREHKACNFEITQKAVELRESDG